MHVKAYGIKLRCAEVSIMVGLMCTIKFTHKLAKLESRDLGAEEQV